MWKLINRFYRLSWRRKTEIITIFGLLGWYRIIVLTQPMKVWSQSLGETGQNLVYLHTPEDLLFIRKLRLDIARIAPMTWWNSNCLAQALCAAHLLRQHHVSYQLFLGVLILQNEIKAHAWLKSDNIYVTGEYEHERYHVVTTYTFKAQDHHYDI
jgi:hypothetical protein